MKVQVRVVKTSTGMIEGWWYRVVEGRTVIAQSPEDRVLGSRAEAGSAGERAMADYMEAEFEWVDLDAPLVPGCPHCEHAATAVGVIPVQTKCASCDDETLEADFDVGVACIDGTVYGYCQSLECSGGLCEDEGSCNCQCHERNKP